MNEPTPIRLTPRERAIAYRLRSRHNVGRAVIHARVSRGMTQKDLAERAGIDIQVVRRLENARHGLRFDSIERIAFALGLEVTLVPATNDDSHDGA